MPQWGSQWATAAAKTVRLSGSAGVPVSRMAKTAMLRLSVKAWGSSGVCQERRVSRVGS
ncbi:hypothetical protein JD81_05864 [Micromonospora sagamiensis]|uniref:Uncharacterized protein n=1 Tax=Micromonospora sagamiensis TaxID=47875 RepID=A0A562WPR0_9ACTN|nr:hypothetical protein JD81_05864 [Micromonospora sagamiensis]